MQTDILNIFIAFLEGLALIASPCILPILPIILAGSIAGSKKRPIGIILGFVLTFALFTFFSRKLVQYTGIDLGLVRHISYLLLILLGIMLYSTYLGEKFNLMMQRLTTIGSTIPGINNKEGGLKSGILFGCLVALIWTPCAGPILAAVIVQTVFQETTLTSFLIILSFGLGAAIPMLIIALFGRGVMAKLALFKSHSSLIRKILGGIIIAAVIYMIYGEGASSGYAEVNPATFNQNTLIDGLPDPYPAPAISGISDWINTFPLDISKLTGKVILIDFWTYSCINCVRTFPYLKSWYAKYHDKGLVIIGIHSPEFEFEKNFANVKNAVEKQGILYPIALDNQFATWQNFKNRYWSAHYLIDKNGFVVYQHFGEGAYDITENNIRFLLGMNFEMVKKDITSVRNINETPEIYLGVSRANHFKSSEKIMEGIVATYTYPPALTLHDWALQGKWIIARDKIVSAEAHAALKIHFNAKNVYVVMGSSTGKPNTVKLLLNGEELINQNGRDVEKSQVTVNKHTLYSIINLKQAESALLQLTANEAGLEIFTFTFGE